MIKTGIVGGSAPEAGELLRILIHHPDVELAWVCEPERSGALVTDIHSGLTGDTYLRFTARPELDTVNLVFCCGAPGDTRRFMSSNIVPERVRVIDLTPDFRRDSELVYGLPELNRKPLVRGARRAAVPGRHATVVALGLLPLAKNLLLNSPILSTVVAASGTGPLAVPDASVGHSAADEVEAALRVLQSSFGAEVTLTAVEGGAGGGMIAVSRVDVPVDLTQIRTLYEDFYADHAFTFVVDRRPTANDVMNTNKCLIHLEKDGHALVVTTVIDDVVKGGAGQAVHCMNLLFGLQECVGLSLKASAR